MKTSHMQMRSDDDVVNYGHLLLSTKAPAAVVAEGLRGAYLACRGLSVLDEVLTDVGVELSETRARRESTTQAAVKEFHDALANARRFRRGLAAPVTYRIPELATSRSRTTEAGVR